MTGRPRRLASTNLASDTSSIFTPDFTPSSTPQPEKQETDPLREETSTGTMEDSTNVKPSDAGTGDKVESKAVDVAPEEVKEVTGKDAQPAPGEGKSSKASAKCKKHGKDGKSSAKEKKRRKKAESSSSSSDDEDSSSDANDTDKDSSSDSSVSEDRAAKKSKSRKTRHATRESKRLGKKARRRDASSSAEAEASDDDSSDSDSEPVRKRRSTKKSKKSTRRRKTETSSEDESSGEADNEGESVLEQAQTMLKSMGIKAKSLKLEKTTTRDSRRAGKKQKRRKSSAESSPSPSSPKKSKKPAFFRGDELWDNETHRYEVNPTAESGKSVDDGEYVFTVKRKFDWEGKFEDTVVDIHAKPLKDCLSIIMESCKSISLAEDSPTVHPDTLFLYLEDMRVYRTKLKAQLKAGEAAVKGKDGKAKKLKKQEKKSVALKIAQLKCMLKYLDKDYAATKSTLYPLLEEGNITFELLWTLFRSDEIIYTPTYTAESEPRAFRAQHCTKESSFMRGIWYEIEGKYLDYDGKNFGLGRLSVDIESYKGVRKINTLACFPLKFHPEAKDLNKQLVTRGKKFVDLAGMQYKFLRGLGFTKKRGQIVKVNVNGRVMCDPATFRRINPNYPISTVKREDPAFIDGWHAGSDEEEDSDCCCCGEGDEQDPYTPRTRTKMVVDNKGDFVGIASVDVDDDGNELYPNAAERKDIEAAGDGNDDIPDEDLLIASPVVLGFAFGEKLWLELSVSGMSEISWNDGAFDSLVLPDAQKSIVKALVTAHAAEAKTEPPRNSSSSYSKSEPASGADADAAAMAKSTNIDDVIQGKGKGLVAVLHGAPGTGKTLTAEGIAELLRCPLYCVSAGELGTNPRELEQELTKILDVAHVWGAVLLLDEADVFLEARTAQDIHRNALVSIFLRLLEYFQGILFLTTNRVNSFDEAFQSRIHVALRYMELDYKARRKVWEMFLEKVRSLRGLSTQRLPETDLERIARKQLNGRQIKNAVRSAQALAVNEKKPLAISHIEKVLDVAESFERDLKGGSGYMDAMRSYT